MDMELSLEEMLLKQKETGSHYTPTGLADVIARRMIREWNPVDQAADLPVRVLDPACGDGELLLSFNRIGRLEGYSNFELIGVDEEKKSIEQAELRLQDIGANGAEFITGDFLEMVHVYGNWSLFEENNIVLDPVDLVIANPPYVRTQILGSDRAQKLAEMFNLKGRVDLYHAFLVAMTLQLKPGGLLGVITSNKYLTTKGGESLRQFLQENYEIIEIMDLGDTKLFSAAVLPSIFIGRRKMWKDEALSSTANFYKIYEETKPVDLDHCNQADSIFEVLESTVSGTYRIADKVYSMSVGKLIIPESPKDPWVMATHEELSWIARVREQAYGTIEDLCSVKVGIKTTADNVFIKEAWGELPAEIRPEPEVLKPLFSTEHAAKWRPLERVPEQKILYTHESLKGKRKVIDFNLYPHAMAYLETHKEQLAGRDYVRKAKRNWYEIWVPQNPDLLDGPKLIFPDISPEPKFFYEDSGCYVDGNCYWIIPKEDEHEHEDLLFLILGISNTRFMTNFHDIAFQNKLYAGRRRYLTQYVSKYPVPDPSSEYAGKIVQLVRELVFHAPGEERIMEIEGQLEHWTALAFGGEPLE